MEPYTHYGDLELQDLHAPPFSAEPSQRLHGDFYCEQDDVTRGTVVSSTFDFACSDLPGYFVPCDKAVLGSGLLGDAYRSDWSKDGACTLPEWKQNQDNLSHCDQEATMVSQFTDSVGPPTELACQAALTSVEINDASPTDVANFMYTFLTTAISGVVTKVRPTKFSMKAEAFYDVENCPLSCALKVRIFRVAERPCERSRLVVEFQRRSGDSIAFNQIFGLAKQGLLRQFASHEHQLSEVATERPAKGNAFSASVATAESDDLQPLMDMLVDRSSTEQAEAVAALVAFASASAAGSCAICTLLQDLPAVLGTLLGSSQLKVSYPTARLVSTLAKLADRSVAAPVLKDVAAVDKPLAPMVRSQLAEVLAQ